MINFIINDPLSKKIDFSDPDDTNGSTLLMHCCAQGYFSVVMHLVDTLQLDVNTININGFGSSFCRFYQMYYNKITKFSPTNTSTDKSKPKNLLENHQILPNHVPDKKEMKEEENHDNEDLYDAINNFEEDTQINDSKSTKKPSSKTPSKSKPTPPANSNTTPTPTSNQPKSDVKPTPSKPESNSPEESDEQEMARFMKELARENLNEKQEQGQSQKEANVQVTVSTVPVTTPAQKGPVMINPGIQPAQRRQAKVKKFAS